MVDVKLGIKKKIKKERHTDTKEKNEKLDGGKRKIDHLKRERLTE